MTLCNEGLSLKASVLLNEAKKSFTTSFISQMKAAQIIKKKSLWKWVQKPFNLSHLPLNNCKFPPGPMGRGLSVPLPPYLSPPYFSMPSGSLSTQPPASSHPGLWGSWAPGPAIVLAWEAVQREPWKPESGNIKKKTWATASLSGSLSQANISETAPFQRQ